MMRCSARSGQKRAWLAALALILALAGCGSPSGTPTAVPIPTFDGRGADLPDPLAAIAIASPEALCAELNAAWGDDWVTVIAALETLDSQGWRCDGQDPALQLYPAYYNYGAWLERRGDMQGAIHAYRGALAVKPDGAEAALALRGHNALTPPPPPVCPPHRIESALAAISPYAPVASGGFARLEGEAMVIDDAPFIIRGVNYYPSRAPWRRFLTEAGLDDIARELDLIREAGFNTLRIFVWHEALFECPGSGAVPRPEGFARLDSVIRLAAARNLRLIVTLNDLPDLAVRPIYHFPDAANAQTAFIVARYRDEPAILAWDLRNEGDVDYIRGYASARAVLNWLRALAPQVRALDPNHLITIGWNDHAHLAAELVDFLSLHHWRSADNLSERLAALRAQSSKPILLQEIGYSTPARTEARQAERLRDALTAAESAGLLGWLVWTAFDFPTSATCTPPACPSPDNAEHHYGLWRVDYSPKPALDMLRTTFLNR